MRKVEPIYLDIVDPADLYLALPDPIEKGLDFLYLDLEKGNPWRDPSHGQFISSKSGVESSEHVADFLDTLQGDKLEKDEY